MREIVLDTETTGLNPEQGDRIVEIACLELHHCVPTGRVFQAYVNPQRTMSEGATRISGLTDDFLKPFPLFHQIVDEWLTFVGDAPFVIHNASFDMRFLNAELQRLQYPLLETHRAVDTLTMARRSFPGSPASLDALCKRFGVDNTQRVKHGALLDAELLAEVYLYLRGGRQVHLSFNTLDPERTNENHQSENEAALNRALPRPYAWNHQPTAAEKQAHQVFIQTLKNPLWTSFRRDVEPQKAR